MGHFVLLVDEAKEDVSFPHSRVADNNHFDEEVVLLLFAFGCLFASHGNNYGKGYSGIEY